MAQAYTGTGDSFEPSIGCRFKVEAAMLLMIEDLKRQGLDLAEIALSLADAAEDFVLRLARSAGDEDLALDDMSHRDMPQDQTEH
ncbi:hypothetical protein [Rhizobium sp. SSA_523]|uniref:hypothetical protein n=1 Tax=Rhizobium sp. SSA_523 TaxID=2952477 RepID=UPI0020911FE0|nr:hypothetical protein [Rhizobium sp. SSA_523]MCO5733769.1 hypothetical protein [Rhizobium sp. SSA_523]WKC24956.1 hypothetical protein QTJ18_13195 [Rhizobium sp. SSA_523]